MAPERICTKIINNAKITHRHSSKLEARRENTRSQNYQKRMYKQAKELQKKREMEDVKNQAYDSAVDKMIFNASEIGKV